MKVIFFTFVCLNIKEKQACILSFSGVRSERAGCLSGGATVQENWLGKN